MMMVVVVGICKSSSKLDNEMKQLIEKAAEGYAKRIHDGEKIGISDIISDVMSAIMKKEREFFLLQENKYEEANGFYSRSLQLAIGKLDLKIPRIRIGNNFRPALLPSKWKRVDKDYENLLLALLTNGYSQTQIESITCSEPSIFPRKNRGAYFIDS